MEQPTDLTSVDTTGIAFITVSANGTVSCTRHVKAVLQHAAWRIKNDQVDQATIDLRFPSSLDVSWKGLQPPVTVNPHGAAAIIASFVGEPGIYKYDVYLNGTLAIDPQLEI